MSRVHVVDPVNPQFDPEKINVWKFVADKNPKLLASMSSHNEQKSIKIPARKCSFQKIDRSVAKAFLTDNHLKGSVAHQHAFALLINGHVVAVMTFGRSRYNKNFKWEIIRYACLQGHTVVGGASKLLAGAIRELQSNSIFSYSENMIGHGNLYKQMGFTFLGDTGKGFFWFKNGEILNRETATKSRLMSIYPTEVEIIRDTSISKFMKSKGYTQVFDMGNKRWGMNPLDPEELEDEVSVKEGIFFVEIDGQICQVNEIDANRHQPINVRKIQCREMVKNGLVKMIPTSLTCEFLDEGWEFNTKVPGNSGMTKIRKGSEWKYIQGEQLEKYLLGGWKVSNRNKPEKKYQRAPATNGRIGVRKDGVKKLVSPEDAERMVREEGWELAAASCWRLASDTAKQLGKKLGYVVD